MRVIRIVGGLVMAAVAVISALLVALPFLGFDHYVITGGSMTGTINRGSVVLDREVPTSSLRVGDIITYAPPTNSNVSGLVTHRIIWIGHDSAGRVFRTKGDANPHADPWSFHLSSATQPRVVAHVPHVGYLLVYLSEPRVRILLIGLPAALLTLSLLVGLWQDAGRELLESDASPT